MFKFFRLEVWQLSKDALILAWVLLVGAAGVGIFMLVADVREERKPAPVAYAQTVQVYFDNAFQNMGALDCRAVFPVSRGLPAEAEPLRASLEALFAGPTAEEAAMGYRSWFSSGTASLLRGVGVREGVAYVDLNDPRLLIPGASSSCGSQAFLAQIEVTVLQQPGIRRVVFAMEGDPQPFYEWLQRGCDVTNNYCDRAPFAGIG